MRKIAVRIFYLLLIASCFLLLGTTSSFAQGNATSDTRQETSPSSIQKDDIRLVTNTILEELNSWALCQMVGTDPQNPNRACFGIDPKSNKVGVSPKSGGMIGFLTLTMGQMYDVPAHTIDYPAYLAQNFGFSQKTYAQAQGNGFSSLVPLQPLWIKFRNIVYLLFTVAFVVIGFAIMLRVKIDPRTVMTIENQIPKIIVGIVAVTLSYAISGFLVDMMWLSTYLTINVVTSAMPSGQGLDMGQINSNIYTPPMGFINSIYNSPVGVGRVQIPTFGGIMYIATDVAGSIQKIIASMFTPGDFMQWAAPMSKDASPDPLCSQLYNPICWMGWTNRIGQTLGNVLSGTVGYLISWILGALGFLVVIFALLIALFRLWFSLLYAYITILINIVLAPFYILLGLFPGSALSFSSWLRTMIANLIVFPAVIGMILVARLFMVQFGQAPVAGGGYFIPPLIGNPSSPGEFAAIIGLGIILFTPTMVDQLQSILKAPKFNLSSVAAQVQSGSAMAGAGPKFAFNRLMRSDPYTKDVGALRAGLYKIGGTGKKRRAFIEALIGKDVRETKH